MLRTHQIEDLHLVSVAPEQFRCVRVQFAFAVRYDSRFSPADDVEQGGADESSGLASTGCSKHRNVPVEPGVHRKTHGFSVPFAQKDILRLLYRFHGQYLFEFPIPHPGGGAIGSLLAYREPSGILPAAAEAVTELEVRSKDRCHQQQEAHGFQAGQRKGRLHTGGNMTAGQLDLRLAGHTSGLLPIVVVFQKLAQKTSKI